MSLMQFFGSLIAVTVVAFIASRLFPNKQQLTKERVINNVARYCPHIDLSGGEPSVYISNKGDSAVLLFPNKNDGIALVSQLGDRVVVREITNMHEIKTAITYAGVSFNIGDFTQPKIQMQLSELERNTLLAAIQDQSLHSKNLTHA